MPSSFDGSARSVPTTTIKRARALPNAGSYTSISTPPSSANPGLFLRPHEVPEFDGEVAVFEYEKAGRGCIRLLRLVEVIRLRMGASNRAANARTSQAGGRSGGVCPPTPACEPTANSAPSGEFFVTRRANAVTRLATCGRTRKASHRPK
jgi:hypothetical protein